MVLGVMGAWGGGRMGLFLWTSSDFLGEIEIWSGGVLRRHPTFGANLGFGRVAFWGVTRLFSSKRILVGVEFRGVPRLFKRNWDLVGVASLN